MPENDDESRVLTQSIFETFGRLQKTLNRSFYRSLDSRLNPSQIMIMIKLLKTYRTDGRGLRVSDIASFMGITNSAVTQIITSLEKSGYILREIDRDDRRAVRVIPTEAGRKIMKPAIDELEQRFMGLVAELGAEDSRILSRLLLKVEEYFN